MAGMIPVWQTIGACILTLVGGYYLGRADGIALARAVDEATAGPDVRSERP